MYTFKHPKPIVLKLADENGFLLRQKAADYIAENQNRTGAERGNSLEQGFGALAEIAIRNRLGMPEINPENHPLGYDLLLPSGVKVDIKCRGGSLPFKEQYDSDDEIPREAKHNFFARQLHDERLDADIYVLTHLENPGKKKSILPGTKRQRKWILYICGWVSKERVDREGVFLPRGSLTEQGRTWFTYRGQEIEFYNKNLNGLDEITDLFNIDPADVEKDVERMGDLNLTSVDAVRIAYDLVGRGILTEEHLAFVQKDLDLAINVKPILHPNQYFHLLKYLEEKGIITGAEIQKAQGILREELYTGI